MLKNTIVKGTFILTLTGFLTRLIGFFFRIFLSHTFGEEQMGLYQLIFPIYALCFSLSSAGIETALARSVAQKIAYKKKEEADTLLYHALILSVSLTFFLGFCVRNYSSFLSIYALGDLRCETLLEIMSYALPFAAIHSCICGYYLGLKQTKLPALSQFLEQIFRVGSIFVLYKLFTSTDQIPSVWIAVLGLVFGECISALFCIRYFFIRKHVSFSFSNIYKHRKLGNELLSLSIPLTSNRVLMNILQSVETISIPLCLQNYGFSNSEALSTYGVLTGMALPCIMFPTAITNSVSTMLLPTVAEIQAEENCTQLKQLIQKVFLFGFMLGSICGLSFLVFGKQIGNILFNSELAGNFIRTLAWICPFMYMNTTLISILNGLGKVNYSFIINILGLIIRICGVWLGIALWGMNGYLRGLLLSQLFVSLLCMIQLKRYISKRIDE